MKKGIKTEAVKPQAQHTPWTVTVMGPMSRPVCLPFDSREARAAWISNNEDAALLSITNPQDAIFDDYEGGFIKEVILRAEGGR